MDEATGRLLCAARDKPLLFYHDVHSLACLALPLCLLQISTLFCLCSSRAAEQQCPTLWPILDLVLSNILQVGTLNRFTAGSRSDRTGRARWVRRTPQQWHVGTASAGCEQLLVGCSCFLQRCHKRQDAVWLYLWHCQTPASGLSEGPLRLSWRLSLSLLFGTISYVLEREINIILHNSLVYNPGWCYMACLKHEQLLLK